MTLKHACPLPLMTSLVDHRAKFPEQAGGLTFSALRRVDENCG